LGKRSRQKKEARETRAVPPPALSGGLEQARQLHVSGRLAEAQALYEELLHQQPHQAQVLHMLGVLALQSGRAHRALELISEALSLEPGDAQAHANLASALLNLKRPEEALEHYDWALKLAPGFAGVHHNRGNLLQMLGRHAEAARAFEQLLTAMPDADFALGNLVHSRAQACDFSDFQATQQRLAQSVRSGRRAARPFAFLAVSASAAEQLQCARTYAAYVGARGERAPWNGPRYGHDRIRVAYVSADFREHVVAHLMAPIYERHDERCFKIVGIALGAPDESAVVMRSRRALEQLIDVSAMSDEEAARTLREMEIDIAVDLSGYTQGARPGILARRAAPVQVSYLGFPATMGVPWIDYLLADDFVIPPDSRPFYTEQVVYLPDTFQASDERRPQARSTPAPTREQAGLPETGLICCCFNSAFKLNPTLFSIWMRLLSAEAGAVLWLLGSDPGPRERLRAQAARCGVDPGRLVFAPRVSYEEHLARLTLADLFLDTHPFNAGASATDALWSAVPVLTCAGEALASRMAGGLLRAAGLPELITYNLEEYERAALALARDPARLAALKAQLLATRSTSPLFDGERTCRHLEAAYRSMWERSQLREAPASFAVSNP
jgi:predicted O-linked N-acetylglucosamine transferase (SPINDLY family)